MPSSYLENNMAQRKEESRGINISMCKIKKQVPGNQLVTTGSACVVRWPWEIEFASSKAQGKDGTFVVTTSEVFSQRDSNSETAWRADFLPLNRWSRREKFSLNDVTVHEVPVTTPSQNHAITLTFIPTETLHKQKIMSTLRTDKLETSRSQLCNEVEFQAADRKQPLCYVLSETAMEDDKFSLHCYLLCRNENGSYFLQDHGNKAEIRTLKDFHPSEKPRGSVILNESGRVVGLLAFGDEDEILPLFFAQNMQGDCPPAHVESNTDNSDKDNASSLSEECCGGDGHEMPENDSDADVNRNQNENKLPFINKGVMELRRENAGTSSESSRYSATSSDNPETGSQSGLEDPDRGESLNNELERILNQPQESSFHSIVPQTSNSNDGKEEIRMSEEELQQPTRGIALGKRTLPDGSNNNANKAGGSQLGRSYSETTPMTPRSQKRLLKCQSELSAIPLKSDALVGDVIFPKVYVMDVISRYLDMSCKGIQNWRHLASLNGVSENLQLKCQAGEHHSRSDKMFELLSAENPDLLIGTLKKHLRVLKINDVEHYIQKLKLRDDDKVADILESSDLDIPGRILLMLDLLPDQTWKNLGDKLGVNREKLKHIKTDCANQQENPAGHVINIIYRKEPTMSIKKFEKYLTDIERSDVAKKLHKIPGEGTIYDLYKDLDLMRDVTSMLNWADNSLIKNYKDLADISGIAIDEYESLQPPSAESPTKAVLDDIVRRKPTFTVEELFTNFRDMKRVDVINAISPYFVEEDMITMKRKLKISDE